MAYFSSPLVSREMGNPDLNSLYLVTEHISFYERYGWEYLCMVQGDDGELMRMYKKAMALTNELPLQGLSCCQKTVILIQIEGICVTHFLSEWPNFAMSGGRRDSRWHCPHRAKYKHLKTICYANNGKTL